MNDFSTKTEGVFAFGHRLSGLTRWVERHARLTIVAVGLVTAFFIAMIAVRGVGMESDFTDFLPESDPAVAAYNLAEETYGSPDLFIVALEHPETIFNTATLGKFKELEEALDELPGVKSVAGPATADVIYGTESAIVVEPAMVALPQTIEALESYRERVLQDRNLRGLIVAENGKAGAIVLSLKAGVDETEMVNAIRDLAHQYQGPERVYLAGNAVVRSTVSESSISDMQRLIPFVLLVLVAILYLSFRSARGVLLPLAVVSLSTIWTFGTMALTGQPITPFSVIMPVLLIAIGAADGIHILNKYMEVAAGGLRDRREILFQTMEEMTTPVVLTSVTTAAGFLGLLSSFLWPQRSLGALTAVGILYAMVLSLTLLPALLARLPLPKVSDREEGYHNTPLSRLLARVARVVTRRPAVVLGVAALALALFLAQIPRIPVETQPTQFLGDGHELIQATRVIDDNFGGSSQLVVDVRTGQRDGLKDPALLEQMSDLQDYLLSLPQVGEVSSLAKVVMQLNETLHASDPTFYAIPDDPRLVAQLLILYSGDLDSLALGDFSQGQVIARVEDLSSREMASLVEQTEAYLASNFDASVETELVGNVNLISSLVPPMTSSQITSLIAAVTVAFIIMALLMRSVIASLISMIPLAFAIVGEFGMMGFTQTPLDVATVMLASIAVGVGIDYSIHFMSRYRQEVAMGNSARAFDRTVRTVGKGIVYNAMALTFSFAVLLLSDFQGNVNFGWLVMLTMVVSSVAALVVIPSVLLVRTPAFLKRVAPQVQPSLVGAADD